MNVSDCIFFQLAKASQKATQFFNQKVEHLELTAVQALMINSLMESDHIPAGELGERLRLTSATLTGLVDRIEKLGMVERKPHPTDRRAILICLTPKGLETGAKVLSIVQESNEEYLGTLSPEEATFLRGILKKLPN